MSQTLEIACSSRGTTAALDVFMLTKALTPVRPRRESAYPFRFVRPLGELIPFLDKRRRSERLLRRRCLLCSRTCCTKPFAFSFVWAAHERRESVFDLSDETDGECWWWFECYSCGALCTCEV